MPECKHGKSLQHGCAPCEAVALQTHVTLMSATGLSSEELIALGLRHRAAHPDDARAAALAVARECADLAAKRGRKLTLE